MGLPEPPTSTALDGSCSVIYNNVLYSYSPEAFLSLTLGTGGEWEELTMGEVVSGAVCVLGSDALWVVGGTNDSTDYTGLQKYTFATSTWATITPATWVSKDRQYHAAAYIPADDKIVVFAGTTDGVSTPQDNTWTIQASEPYGVDSFSASGHPGVNPILLQWSESQLCLVGGDTSNTAVTLFNVKDGWVASGTTLATPLADASSMQAAIIDGDDSSKSLYTFDLSTSPNTVSRFLVLNADGSPVVSSAALKRSLTASNWPDYNSTLAPDSVRSDFSIAQSSDGTVVFSGGNDDVPLAMFDATDNSWVDTEDVFATAQKQLVSESTTSASSKTKSSSTKTKTRTRTSSTFATSATVSSTATSTDAFAISDTSASATSTSTETAAAAAGSSGSLSSGAVLGITLGSILGFLAVLIAVLLLLRRRKRENQAQSSTHNRGPSSDEKAPIVLNNAPNPSSAPGHLLGHKPQFSTESYSSMAILMGRAGKSKPGLTRKPSNDSNRSSSSTIHKQFKATIGKPMLQDMQHPALQNQEARAVAFDPNVAEPRPRQGPIETEDGMRRSSGWNRYWSGGSALQILGFGGPPKRATVVDDDRSSHYSQSTQQQRSNPRVTQDSATVPPLNFEFRPEFNRVNSGSPVVEKYNDVPFKEGMAVKIERPTSKASSGYSSGIPESVNDQWDSNHTGKPWGADRAPSSVYNPSFYFGTPLSPSTTIPRNTTSGVSTQPQLAMASTSSDMSWLNLGDRRV